MGSRPNVLFLDEIFDTLDQAGTEKVIGLLHELSKSKESIFVVTHTKELKSYFQNHLVVVKKGKISRIKEAA